MQCLAKTWPIQLNEKGAFPLGHKILQSRKFFKLGNRERDAESKSAMRSCYSTGCTCLLLNKGSTDKEILILFQNKYYCLPVLDIPVSERNGNRERKSSCISFFLYQSKIHEVEVSLCFLPYFFAPVETILLKLAGD